MRDGRLGAGLGRSSLLRLFWYLTVAAGLGAAGALIVVTRSRPTAAAASTPPVTWPADTRRAPPFALRDQEGGALSLSEFRGQPVIVTFIDPLCRNLCPLEARVLSQAVRRFPNNPPAIIAVSVDPWADTTTAFAEDAAHWDLAPSWRWGVGSQTALASVWRHYGIGVQVSEKTIAGITVREIGHTEAAYLIDGRGYERTLLMWPFTLRQATTAIHAILSATT